MKFDERPRRCDHGVREDEFCRDCDEELNFDDLDFTDLAGNINDEFYMDLTDELEPEEE